MATRPFAAIRERLGWSLNTAAIRLGCSPGHLRALENSRVPLSQEFAGKMAERYGVTLNELFINPTRAGGTGNTGGAVRGNTASPAEKRAA